MKLFDRFKLKIASNDVLCSRVSERILANQSNEYIKSNFSQVLVSIHDEIYKEYLSEQEHSGQLIIDQEIQTYGSVSYGELDSFFLSISQSRKSRAGKAFELIIRELLTRLGYPFSEQITIDGAKPDYVLPSENHFIEKPLDSILLTAKRTLRERWRQVVTEANKGYGYYLVTLDENISKKQLENAATHKIYVIVPLHLKTSVEHYSESYNVITFEDFFRDVLDPAMTRWGREIAEPELGGYNTKNKSLL